MNQTSLSSQNMASKPGGAWVIRVSLNLKLGLTRSSKHGLHTNTFRFYDDIMIWLCPSQYISSIQNEGTKNMCGCKDIITISSQLAYCFSKVILLLKLCRLPIDVVVVLFGHGPKLLAAGMVDGG